MKLGLKELQGEKSLLVVGSWMDVCRKRAGLHRKAGKLWINIPWSRLYVMSPALWISSLHDLFFLNFYLFIYFYLFMAVLGLRFCTSAFSSCGKWGPLFIVVRGPLTIAASLVSEHRLQTRRLSNCGSRA